MHNGYRLPESYIVDVLDHDINYDKKIRDKSKMRMLLRSLARVDAIVELRDGDFGAIEIKLGVGKIEEAVKVLINSQMHVILNQNSCV